jgi:hypothetical protein
MQNIVRPLRAVLGCLAAITFSATAGPPGEDLMTETVCESPYQRGFWEIQAMAGAYWDLEDYNNQPTFDYVLESLGIGYMVINATGRGLWRGNFELLVDAVGGEFFRGPANYLVGGTFSCGGTLCRLVIPNGCRTFRSALEACTMMPAMSTASIKVSLPVTLKQCCMPVWACAII